MLTGPAAEALQRVRARTSVSETGCHVCDLTPTQPYARVWVSGRMVLAHRLTLADDLGVSLEYLDSTGQVVDHVVALGCSGGHCVNPSHLEAVTQHVNAMRGTSPSAEHARKTTCPRGHRLAGRNLVASFLRRGVRDCLICARARARVQYHKTSLADAVAHILAKYPDLAADAVPLKESTRG